jgi:hypothetical protein
MNPETPEPFPPLVLRERPDGHWDQLDARAAQLNMGPPDAYPSPYAVPDPPRPWEEILIPYPPLPARPTNGGTDERRTR